MPYLLAQICCTTGGVIGLWLGFHAGIGEVQAADTMLAVGWRVLAGVVAGAFCAWTATVLVPQAWSRRRRLAEWAVKDSNLQPWD